MHLSTEAISQQNAWKRVFVAGVLLTLWQPRAVGAKTNDRMLVLALTLNVAIFRS